jgi:hypothetical protein
VKTLTSRLGVHAGAFSRRILIVAALAVLAAPAEAAADTGALEYKVKASYLYKFGEFVKWPPSAFPSPESAVNLCVAGKDPFGEILDQAVAGQQIEGRPISVRRLAVVERNSECHILYVAGSEQQSVAQALDAVRGANMLTVTESDGGQARGIVNFITQDSHVRFDIDEQAAERNGLTISSKLLQLALSFRRKS